MQLDLQTMSAVNVTVTTILGGVLLLTWARERENPLIGWWGLALLVQAAGLAIILSALPANGGDLLAAGSATIILGEGIKWKAAREFADRRAWLFWILLGPVGFVLALQSGFLQSFSDRLDAFCTILTLYNFATAYAFSRAKGEQPVSRWPAVILLVMVGLGYLSWLPLNLAMPIHQSQWVAASIWFPVVVLVTLLLRVAIAFVVLSLAKERSAMVRRAEALTDSLTGLPNRRALFEAADAFGQVQELRGGAVSVLIFDLDHFTEEQAGARLQRLLCVAFVFPWRPHAGDPVTDPLDAYDSVENVP